MSLAPSMTDTKKVDLLNIGLLGAAWGAALLFPFPLFLFAYAVLGPLHYLTEISWLHDRSYFIPTRRGKQLFVSASAIITAGILSGYVFPALAPTLVYALFGGAFIFSVIKQPLARDVAIAVLFVTAVFFAVLQPPAYTLLFALLIPTIIHVFFFTWAFMLSGALRSMSLIGLSACFLFLLAAGSLFVIIPDRGFTISQYVFDSYQPFAGVNAALLSLLSIGGSSYPTAEDIFSSRAGQGVMQFIAFAYTYHYLNWFSKVRVIGWNGMPSFRRKAIGAGWMAALTVYAYDYRIGVQVLFFLSFLHVLLEFPLNHRSFSDIGQRIVSLFPRRQIEA